MWLEGGEVWGVRLRREQRLVVVGWGSSVDRKASLQNLYSGQARSIHSFHSFNSFNSFNSTQLRHMHSPGRKALEHIVGVLDHGGDNHAPRRLQENDHVDI